MRKSEIEKRLRTGKLALAIIGWLIIIFSGFIAIFEKLGGIWFALFGIAFIIASK